MSLKSHQLWTLRRCGFRLSCLLSPAGFGQAGAQSQPGAGGWGLPSDGWRSSAPAFGPASHSGLAVGGRVRGWVGARGLLVGIVLLDRQGLWVHGLHVS